MENQFEETCLLPSAEGRIFWLLMACPTQLVSKYWAELMMNLIVAIAEHPKREFNLIVLIDGTIENPLEKKLKNHKIKFEWAQTFVSGYSSINLRTKKKIWLHRVKSDEIIYWVRDPFIAIRKCKPLPSVGSPFGRIDFYECGSLQNPEAKNFAEEVMSVIEPCFIKGAAYELSHRPKPNHYRFEPDWFKVAGGNILGGVDFALVGANNFSNIVEFHRAENPEKTEQELIDISKFKLADILGIEDANLHIILEERTVDNKCTWNPILFNKCLWSGAIESLEATSGVNIKIKKDGIQGQSVSQNELVLENINTTLVEFIEFSRALAEKKHPWSKSNTDLRNRWLELLELTYAETKSLHRDGIFQKIPHIDLFLTILPHKYNKDNKIIKTIVVADPYFFHHESKLSDKIIITMRLIRHELNKVKKYLKMSGFKILNCPIPYICGEGYFDGYWGFYNNCMVESVNGGTVWLPSMSSSSFRDVDKQQLAEADKKIERFWRQKAGFKNVNFIEIDFYEFIKKGGALHCLSNDFLRLPK